MAWTREEREGVLEELWPMVKDGQREMRERLEAALGIIEAHWNESFEHYYDRDWEERHPTFKEYGAGFLTHHLDLFPREVAPALLHHLGTDPDLLVPGHTLWAPPGSPERKEMEGE